MREEQRRGVESLGVVTQLLQRIRTAHPTDRMYEAADLQWWWRSPRPTDSMPQLFWVDDMDRPVAAAIATDWDGHVALAPVIVPELRTELIATVVERGLQHASDWGFERISIEVAHGDDVLRRLLLDRSFEFDEDGYMEAWLDLTDRPAVSPLPDSYRLVSRVDTLDRPHHMIDRSGSDVEIRLRQTSLYRPDLDLLVLDPDDEVAAYGLFWLDPVTDTGLVEPMRTEDDHQGRGLGRHVLTAGLDLLATYGAGRVKICYEPTNATAGHLYQSVGFEPVGGTDVFTGPTRSR